MTSSFATDFKVAQVADNEQLSAILKSFKRKLSLVSKERDILKGVVNSYQSILRVYESDSSEVDESDSSEMNRRDYSPESGDETKEPDLSLTALTEKKEFLDMKVKQLIEKLGSDDTVIKGYLQLTKVRLVKYEYELLLREYEALKLWEESDELTQKVGTKVNSDVVTSKDCKN